MYNETKELVNIDTVKHIVYGCFNDAITDKCLDNTTREHIEQCDKQCLNSALFEKCASLYEKLLQTGNAEKFYASFYNNIVANAVDKFLGLLFPSCTTIAMKIADTLLTYSREDCTQSQKHNEKELSSREVDALQYLAGYIIKNRKEQFKQNILQLIENAKCNEYECYPVVIKEAITSYDNPPSETIFSILQDIVEAFRKNRNGNTFLASYYSQIVLNAQLYFIGLPTCTLFSKTLCDYRQ